jgi:hypothetical protein
MLGYWTEHFKRYINYEYLKNNYEDIVKTGFDFPRIFIMYIKDDLPVWWEEMNQLLNEYYPNPEKENEYYPILKLIEFTNKYPEYKNLIKPCVLNYPNNVALIFSKTPRRWGLRGDPYFWTYLEELFLKSSIPMNIDDLDDIIFFKYYKLSGKKIGEIGFVEEFAHGGMSSGSISPLWLEYIPLLQYRLLKLNNEYYLNHGEPSKIVKNPEKIIKTTDKTLDEILAIYDEPFTLWKY